MGATWQSPRLIMCTSSTLQAAGKTLFPPLPHPLVQTNSRQICKVGCPRSKRGIPFSQHQHSFASGAAVPRLHNTGVALVKQQIPHFLVGQSPWEAATKHGDLGPGLEPPTAATSREQRVAIDPGASPLVTKQLGAWYGPVTPSPPPFLMRASANTESRNAFSSGINATLPHRTGRLYQQ